MASFQEFFAGGAVAPVPESGSLHSAPVSNRTKTAAATAIAPYVESSSPEPFRPGPHGTGEMFIEGSRAGAAQLGSDIQRVGAIWNIRRDDEEGAERRLNLASIRDQESANLLAGFGTFEEFLDQPTYESFWEQVVKNVGQFTPMAVSSIASGFTGAIAGAAAKGTISVASKALIKKELQRIIKKKHLLEQSKKISPGPARGFATAGEAGPGAVMAKSGRWYAPGTAQGRTLTASKLTADEEVLLRSAFSYSQAIKTGAITGAFGQEWVMGAGQSLGEYQEAGLELTKKEANMAAALGIPQAMLGVFSEVAFVGGMARIALRKSGGRAGSRWGKLAKDIAGGFTRSATVESVTEAGQEGIQIAQRMSVDPDYTQKEALLRVGEASFAGFFAGGARGGAGGTVAGVFGAAKDLVSQGISFEKDVGAGRGPGQGGGTMPEPQANINAQYEAMFDPSNNKDAVWVDKDSPQPTQEAFDTGRKSGKEVFMREHKEGTLYTTDRDKVDFFDAKADPDQKDAVSRTLRDILGYSVMQRPEHDAVVAVKDEKGRTLWDQTTFSDDNNLSLAKEQANKLFPNRKPSISSPEETVRQRSMFDEDSPFYKQFLEEEAEESGDLGGTMEDMAQGVNIEAPVLDYAKDAKGNVLNYAPRGENVAPRAVDETTGEILVDPELEEALRKDGLVNLKGDLTVDPTLLRNLSDSFIKRYLDLRKADVDKTTVFVPEERGGKHLIRTETAPASRVTSTIQQVERGVGKAEDVARAIAVKTLQGKGIKKPNDKQILAELKKGWSIQDRYGTGEITYVDMHTLTNVGRKINQQEGTTRVEDDQGTAAMGFSTIMAELANQGYLTKYAGKDVTLGGLNEAPGNAVIYRRGSEKFTLAQLPTMMKDKKVVQEGEGTFDPDVDISPRTTTKQTTRKATRADVERHQRAGLSRPFSSSLPPLKVGDTIQETVATEGQRIDAGELGLEEQRRQAAKQEHKKRTGEGRREATQKDVEIYKKAGFPPIKVGEIIEDTAPIRVNEELSARYDDPTSIQDIPPIKNQEKIELWKTMKAKRGMKEVVLKDKEGFPLTKKYGSMTINNRPAAQIHASNSIARHLPGFKDFITAIQQFKFFGLQRNIYLLNQIDARKGDLAGWIEALGMNETQAKDFKAAVNEWNTTPEMQGKFINVGEVDFILVKTSPNPNSVNGLQAYLTLGHEIGHAIYLNEVNRSLGNKKLRRALEKAFERAKFMMGEKALDNSQYLNKEFGFEEWFADQVSIALMRKAQDVTYKTTSPLQREFIPYTEAEKAAMRERVEIQIKGRTPGKKIANELRETVEGNIALGKLTITPGEQKMVDGYFKGVARKIKQLFRQLSKTYQQRFGKQSAVFSEYVNEVTRNYKKYHEDLNSQNRAPPTYSVQVYQRDMVDASLDLAKEYFPPHVAGQVRKAAKSILRKGWDGLRYILYTADGFLKTLGPVGREIAMIFYAGSQTENLDGFLDVRSRRVNEWANKVAKALGLPDSSAPIPQDVVDALLEAENDTIPDIRLSKKALAARQVLAKLKKEYIDISDTKVSDLIKEDKDGNQIGYFGRRISLTELQGDPNKQAAFAKLLVEFTSNDEKSAMKFVQELVSKGQLEEEFGFTDTELGTDLALGMPHAKRRELAAIPTSRMRKIGILEAPEVYLRKYVDTMVKKVEYDKRGGHSRVNELINQIKDPTDRERARNAVKAMLGKTDGTMPNWYRNTQSVVLAWNIVTLLAFAALASLPDLAGPVLRSKDFNSLKYAVKEMVKAATNTSDLRAMARDIGVVASESIQTMYINAAELEAMNPTAKKITEGFFKYTGTEWFTNFSRVYATGMSRQFLLHHAESNTTKSARYLSDMGVSKADIKATFDAEGNPNFDSEAGQRVKDAMGKFVDESIVRPNAAERPVWASDPRLAWVWQLKSFFYAYGKNIVGGAITEGQRSWRGGEGIGGAGTLLVLAGLTMLPLSMVGLEIREFLKSGIAWTLPGTEGGDRFYQTDKMEWGEYLFEILDRSGIFGPLTIAIPMYQANDYGDQFWVPPLGPSAERVEDLFTHGMGYVIREGVPVYSAIGGIQADR